MERLNELVHQMIEVNNYMTDYRSDPMLGKKLINITSTITTEYGMYLHNEMRSIYNQFFPEDSVQPMLEYLWHEVRVNGDHFNTSEVLIGIKANPLRVVVRNEIGSFLQIIKTLEGDQTTVVA